MSDVNLKLNTKLNDVQEKLEMIEHERIELSADCAKMKLDKVNLNSEIESKSIRIYQLENAMNSSVKSYEKTLEHYNDDNLKANEILRDLRRQLEESKENNRKTLQDFTNVTQNMRLFRAQSMSKETELSNLKVKYDTLETK